MEQLEKEIMRLISNPWTFVIFVGMIEVLTYIHLRWIPKFQKKVKRFKMVHYFLALVFWPLYLVETAVDKFKWLGLIALSTWLGSGCLIVILVGVPFWEWLFLFVIGSSLWFAIAGTIAAIWQEMEKPFPFQRPY